MLINLALISNLANKIREAAINYSVYPTKKSEKRLIGLILFELHAAITETGKRKENPETFHSALMDSRKILDEVIALLKYEPLSLPEGKIFAQAVKNLKDIELVLNTVHKTIGDSP